MFQLVTNFQPRGDQPSAIRKIVESIHQGQKEQVLLGATGTGKTFTMANIIQQTQKPTLILAHNKTLAMQIYQEMQGFFPIIRWNIMYLILIIINQKPTSLLLISILA